MQLRLGPGQGRVNRGITIILIHRYCAPRGGRLTSVLKKEIHSTIECVGGTEVYGTRSAIRRSYWLQERRLASIEKRNVPDKLE